MPLEKYGSRGVVHVEFNTRNALYEYLNTFDFDAVKDTTMSSVYFLIEFDAQVMPVYFVPFEDVWFESPCELIKFPLHDKDIVKYVRANYIQETYKDAYDFEILMQRDGWHYEIYNPQCAPFLPKNIKILDVFSDVKCLDWLLNKQMKLK